MTPACSVLLPVRDAHGTLTECLSSIQGQTLRDFEVVAIDDGSTDGSGKRLREFAALDPRWRVLRNPQRGLVSALNHALAQCRSPLVARMDADDVMHPERLALQVAALGKSPDVSVLGTQVTLLEGALTAEGFREYVRWQNSVITPRQVSDQRYVESPFAHPSVMFRRDAVVAAGGYREGLFPEDYELWLRLLAGGARMAKLARPLLQWRDEPMRASRTDPRCAREAFDRLRARFLASDPRVREARDSLVIWGAGRKTRARCARLLDRGFQVRAWIDIDPKKIGNVIRGARVISPAAIPGLASPFILSYVTNHGARDDIRRTLENFGLRQGKDWLSVG